VVHICNPSYSGGRDQEDRSSKSSWAKGALSPKNSIQKRAGGVAQGESPEFKPQYHNKIKREFHVIHDTIISCNMKRKKCPKIFNPFY
jgi:hypothetical protein